MVKSKKTSTKHENIRNKGMNDNKINLSSVNKAKKKNILSGSGFLKLRLKTDSYQRDSEGKFTSGSGGLTKVKNFNLRRAVPLIAVIALVGGYMVYQSFAASTSSLNRVIGWYQACRNSSATNFGGAPGWADQLDAGSANYAKFKATIEANEGVKCPSGEPAAYSPPSSKPQAPAAQSPTPSPSTTTARTPSAASTNKVIKWYQACRNTTTTTFGGTSYWALKLDDGTATYATFRDQMRANGDGVCPENDPTGATNSTPSSSSKPPATTGAKPDKKYHQGRSASPDCFSMPNCVTVVRGLFKTLLARDPGPDSTGVKDYASKMLDWGWTTKQVSDSIKQSSEYQQRQALVQKNIVDYDPSVTDFMDTRSFLWFAYERLCLAGTRSAVNYWANKIDSGEWTRKAFWEHLQSQQCAENVANERIYDKSGQNLTDDGKRAKEIEEQLNKVYWEVFMNMWERGGWKDWDGVHKPGWMWELDQGNKHLAIQMACEQIVWRYKNNVPVGLNDTCFNLVTGQNKPIHSQDIMYGDYFGDTVTMEEAIARIRAIEDGQDQSVSCQSTKAQVLPGCDAGAKYVPIKDLEKLIEDREKQQNTNKQQDTKKTNNPQSHSTGTSKPPSSSSNNETTSDPKPNSKGADVPIFGDETQSAIYANFQAYIGLENSVTNSVVFPNCENIDTTIEPDDEGECVEYVQNALALIVDPSAKINGIFDNATQSRLEKFQLSRNVPAAEHGKVGKVTFRLLEKALAPRSAKSPYSPPSGMFVNNR